MKTNTLTVAAVWFVVSLATFPVAFGASGEIESVTDGTAHHEFHPNLVASGISQFRSKNTTVGYSGQAVCGYFMET